MGKQLTQVPLPAGGADPVSTTSHRAQGRKLELGSVKQVESKRTRGLVLNQDPAGVHHRRRRDEVNIEVSTGVVDVPGVIGFTQSAATSALSKAGLDVSVVTASSDQPAASSPTRIRRRVLR